jgi:hypothetical protein
LHVREASSLLFVAGSPRPIKIGDTVEITGVGFFDFEHGVSSINTTGFDARLAVHAST